MTSDWTEVNVPRQNLFNWKNGILDWSRFGDDYHTQIIENWCRDHFQSTDWHRETGTKKFKFRNAQDATLFQLRWP